MDKPTSRNNQEKNKRQKKDKEPAYMAYARYSSMAFQTGIVVGLFTWGGYELDDWLNTSFPVFLTIGLFIGLAGGIYLSIKDFIKKK